MLLGVGIVFLARPAEPDGLGFCCDGAWDDSEADKRRCDHSKHPSATSIPADMYVPHSGTVAVREAGRRRGEVCMPRWGRVVAGAIVAVGLAVQPASAATQDFAQTARNIIPSGQYGSVPIPPGADTQAKMYDGLTPLFDHVTFDDLTQYFKSERFGSRRGGPADERERPTCRSDRSPATSSTCLTSRQPPTPVAFGLQGGSRRKIAACCSSRLVTTRASRRSTPRD